MVSKPDKCYKTHFYGDFRKFRDSALRTEFNQMSIRNNDAIDEDLSPLSGGGPTVASGNQKGRGSESEPIEGEIRLYVNFVVIRSIIH